VLHPFGVDPDAAPSGDPTIFSVMSSPDWSC